MTHPMQQKVSATFEEWSAKFNELQAKFKGKVADARMEHQTDEWRQNLENKFNEGREQLNALKDASDETAAEVRAKLEEKMEEIRSEMDR